MHAIINEGVTIDIIADERKMSLSLQMPCVIKHMMRNSNNGTLTNFFALLFEKSISGDNI